MSIFGITTISLLVGCVGLLTCLLVFLMIDSDWVFDLLWVAGLVGLLVWLVSIPVGIAISDENDKVFVQTYLVQKQTIEDSLANDQLSGFERVELVKEASELNAALAARKTKFNLWHHVHFDSTIYDNIEFIDLSSQK